MNEQNINNENINNENVNNEQKNKQKENEQEKSKKSNEELAFEVIDGKWGEGEEIKTNLEGAGYNFKKVQKLVNLKLGKEEKVNIPEYYVVKHGDTLKTIAKKFKTTEEELIKINNNINPSSIFASNQLRVK